MAKEIKEIVLIRMPPDMRKQLERRAKLEKKTLSDVIRDGCALLLEFEPGMLVRARSIRDLGLQVIALPASDAEAYMAEQRRITEERNRELGKGVHR